MQKYVLDTHTLLAILREDPVTLGYFSHVLNDHEHLFLACPSVYFSIRGSLLAMEAHNQLARFEALHAPFAWQDFTRADWDRAAKIDGRGRATGRAYTWPVILLTAFVWERGATLVTPHTDHYTTFGLRLEDWST